MINVQKNRVTPAELVIIAWTVALVMIATFFFHVFYKPAIVRLLDEKDQVELSADHLRWVTQTIDAMSGPQSVYDYFAAKDHELDRRFPDSETKSLLAIADYANKFHVRLEQVHASAPQAVSDSRGTRAGADGKKCSGVRVSMNFKSAYPNLVKYIEALRKIVPAYMVVEKLEVTRGDSNLPELDGKIELVLYLLVG